MGMTHAGGVGLFIAIGFEAIAFEFNAGVRIAAAGFPGFLHDRIKSEDPVFRCDRIIWY